MAHGESPHDADWYMQPAARQWRPFYLSARALLSWNVSVLHLDPFGPVSDPIQIAHA